MTNSTTQDGSAAGGTVAARAERSLRVHAERSEAQLRELESDMVGLQTGHSTIQEDLDGARRLIESVRSDLVRVRRALDRIESGTFGRCTACGEAIAVQRLVAIPESEHCHQCA